MARVRLLGIAKTFGQTRAVDSLDLDVPQGEFFSLLGPSGCGKTTTLRMIAGFEKPDTGQIFFGEHEVTQLAPQQRNVGMVFQSYALFPHMTAGENIAFGLRARGAEKSSIPARVTEALRLVDLVGYEDRPVTALSGGQQQRVALARAIVIEPEILLLDEPLSNLDARLRIETREQIRALQQRLQITTFYVTHDQDEALAQSDRLAVFLQGRCAQVGTPREVYAKPVSREVMAFLGKANFLTTTVETSDGDAATLQVSPNWRLATKSKIPGDARQLTIGFRPHHIALGEVADDTAKQARVREVIYTGATEELVLEFDGIVFTAQRSSHHELPVLHPGELVPFSLREDAVQLFAETG